MKSTIQQPIDETKKKKKVKIIKVEGRVGIGGPNPSEKLFVSNIQQRKKKKISYKSNTKVSSRGRKNEHNYL